MQQRRLRRRQSMREFSRRLVRAAVRLAHRANDALERGLAGREWSDPDAELRSQTRGVYVMVGMLIAAVAIEYAAHHPLVNLFPVNR